MLALALAGTARGDFAVQTCVNGAPAPPWINGLQATGSFATVGDGCGSGGAFAFNLAGTYMQPSSEAGAGLQMPSGEVITRVQVHYDTIPQSSGSESFLRIAYDSGFLVNDLMGNATAGTDIDAALPDASILYFNVFCSTSASTGCGFDSANVLTIGAMTLTLHDTGQPDVQVSGGTLATRGTYGGIQTVSYTAADTGSGVQRVTASLGATVAGTAANSCQTFALRPCPASAAGTVEVDTRTVPDGTYPVTLAAYDASGDPTSVPVGTVTVRNQSGTTALPAPKGGRRVHARVKIGWRWSRSRTVLTELSVARLPRRATVAVSCSGRRCPFSRRHAIARHVKRLVRGLRGAAFHAGERVSLAISAPHLKTQRATLKILRNAQPALLRR